MAKYVHPNMIVDSSVSFLKNVTFDSSVYLQGVTHISSPAAASLGTPYALVVDSLGADVQIKNIQLGTMAFETSTNYYVKTEVDGLISDLSTFVFDRLDDIDSSISGLDLLTQQFATDINDVSLRVEDIEASLGDYVRKDGDTMTGLLTLAAAGFSLDGTTITDIDTSAGGGLTDSETALATSGAIKSYVDQQVVAGVTASNGLTEVGSDIQLGGALTRDTSIDVGIFNLSLLGLETGNTLLSVISDAGVLKTQQLGTMALEASANYYYASQVNTLVSDLSTLLDNRIDLIDAEISQLDASIVRIDASLNDVIDIFDVIDASFAAVWTAIDNLETSVGDLDTLTQTHTADIAQLDASIVRIDAYQAIQDASIIAAGTSVVGWNGVTRTDNSIGLGGALDIATTITATATETLSLAGLQTSSDSTPYAVVQESVGGPLMTRELGDMAWETVAVWDASLSAIRLDITDLESSVGVLNGLIQTNITNIDYLETSVGVLNGLIQTNISDISNLETSVYTVLNSWNLSQDASIVDLRNTSLSALQTANNGLTASDTSVALGGALTHDTDIDATRYTFSVTGGMSIYGTLTVDGSVTYVNSVDLNVSDNIITVNYGETGSGVSKGFAGLKIDRGDASDYVLVFAEATDTFRIGIADESGLPTGTQAVATREDTPVSWGVGFWNGTAFRIDTSAGFTFEPGVGLSLPIATVDNNEITSLMIDSNGLVVSRDLGTMAFATATDYVLQSLFDTSIAAIWTKLGSVDTSISGLDTLTQTHTTDINNLESSVGALDLLTQSHTQSITDLSTGKLDAVANLNVVGDASVFAYETDNVAYLKKLVAGAGVVVTEDVSTITISGDTASGVYKYTGTFTPMVLPQ